MTDDVPITPQRLRDLYDEVQPCLDHVRFMHRFMDVLANYEECRPVQAQLWGEYRDMLNEEFAPHAYSLASFIVQLLETIPEAFPYGAFPTPETAASK
jgi:hypothetical protein